MPILGTPGNDVFLSGTAGADEILLLGGDDFLTALDGDDTIYGGNGNDTISDGPGNDLVFAGRGNDSIEPYFNLSEGDDSYFGGEGNDTIVGGLGEDLLNGGADNDDLYGGEGSDTYVVTHGFDTIYEDSGLGEAGDRILFSTTLSTAVWEIYRIGATLYIDVAGGPVAAVANHFDPFGLNSTEVETVAFLDGVELALLERGYTTYGTEGDDFISGVTVGGLPDDTIHGYGGSDTVLDGAGTDVVFGGTGDDVLGWWLESVGDDSFFGDGGDDQIAGGSGNDLLDGGDGTDSMVGGVGDDSYVVAGGPDDIEEFGGGDDLVRLSETAFADGWTLFRLGSELVIEVAGQRVATLVNHFNPFGIDDTEIETLAFSDGAEIDLLEQSYVTFGTVADDWIYGIGVGGLKNDTIYGGGGNDWISGHEGNNSIDGDNVIFGENGRDTLTGGDFTDMLYGGNRQDRLFGGFGDDVLDGGANRNRLFGGYGDDTYVVGDGFDFILDERGADTLQFIEGISLDDLSFSRLRNDLRIRVDGELAVSVRNQFFGSDATVETVVFADGSTFDLTTVDL